MKPRILAVVALCAVALESRARAQCPFTVQFSTSGSACTQSGALPPTLTGTYVNGPGGCSVTFALGIPPLCCNTFVQGRFLVLGGTSVSIPVPGGCDLLVFPDLIVALPAANPSVTFPLPPDPALVGLLVFGQGVVVRFTTIGFMTDFDFTSRLHIQVQ